MGARVPEPAVSVEQARRAGGPAGVDVVVDADAPVAGLREAQPPAGGVAGSRRTRGAQGGGLRRNRDFLLLWAGEAASVTGAGMTSVLLPLVAVSLLDASPTWMGMIAAATWLPWLVVGLPIGAWVDGRSPRAVMIGANSVSTAAYASVPVAAAFGLLGLWQLVVVALVVGTATIAFRSAYTKLLVRIVPERDRPVANSLLFGTENAANTVGPGLGGLVGQLVGPVRGMLGEAVGLAISVVCLVLMRPQPPTTAPQREPLRASVRSGLRLVFGDRRLRFFAVQGAVANFGLIGQQAVLVLWLSRDLRLDPAAIGIVFALSSIGGVVGALAAPALGRLLGDARGVSITLTAAGLMLPLLAFAQPGPVLWLVVSANAVAVAGIVAANVLRRTWVQSYVPERMLARQATSAQLVNFAGMPIAGVLAGVLAEQWGPAPVIFAMGVVALLANAASWLQPWLRRRDLPRRTESTPPE
ncbi:MFS transporter [Agromyces sp. NPDC058104]|uniref:MFS transporter n=1 Tax=Agromyces sp. NPDC058104 TaxID=3346342 RepID=UPI0036D84FBF